jgi:E3 ubiquitin-protein ligase ATL4
MNSTNIEASTIPPPASNTIVNNHPGETTGSKGASFSASLIILFAILVVIAVISIFFIHRLIRCFCHDPHSSSYRLPVYRTFSIGNTGNAPALSAHEIQELIDTLPTFTLGSSMAKLPKSSLDCAVCCDPFLPDAVLRLLPACCHAFHKPCVDVWLRSNPSCPLCRSSITLPHPALPELPSGSIRLELGSISSRRSEPSNQIQNHPGPTMPPMRTYSFESHDYCIEEEFEIVPPRVTRSLEKRGSDMSDLALPPPPPPPPPLLPPSAPPLPLPPIRTLTREEPVRGWLAEFLDRLSSASSSFNSMRFASQRWSDRWTGRGSGRWSQRSSQRFDSGVGGVLPPDSWMWDLEAGRNEETGDAVALYRWIVGI